MLKLEDIKEGILQAVIVNGVITGITLYTDDVQCEAIVRCALVEYVRVEPLDDWVGQCRQL